MERLLTAEETAAAFEKLHQAMRGHLPKKGLVVIGIRTRGQVLAQRLVERLRQDGLSDIRTGVLDITFYRDDLSRRKGVPLVKATEIDFNLDDQVVLLVDDVLATGRSIRAALDALVDFGRPKVIRLAVLIDRGGRELPIAADFCGLTTAPPAGKRLQVHLKETDGDDGAYLVKFER